MTYSRRHTGVLARSRTLLNSVIQLTKNKINKINRLFKLRLLLTRLHPYPLRSVADTSTSSALCSASRCHDLNFRTRQLLRYFLIVNIILGLLIYSLLSWLTVVKVGFTVHQVLLTRNFLSFIFLVLFTSLHSRQKVSYTMYEPSSKNTHLTVN